MTILAWTLGLPVAATLVAIWWTHWSSRPRGPEEAFDTVQAYERFKHAIDGSPVDDRRR